MSVDRLPLLAAVLVFLLFPVVVHAQIPTIVDVSPSDSPTPGGVAITIIGSDFGATGSVVVGDQTAPVFEWTQTRIVALTPAGDPGAAPVFVRDEFGQTSNSHFFAYQGPELLWTLPATVPVEGGTVVTITGENFGRVSAPRIWTVDGVPAEETAWNGHTEAEILVPDVQTPGIKPIRLEVNGILSNEVTIEAVLPPPFVAQVSPVGGPTAGGTTVTILGENFGAAGTVRFGNVLAPQQSWSDQQVVVLAPEGDPGPVPLELVREDDGAATPPVEFGYDPPELESVDPTSAPLSGGVVITIIGRNFGTSLAPRNWTVGDIPADEIQYFGHDLVELLLPALDAPGIAPIRLEVNGFVANEIPLEILAEAPVIAQVSPVSGPTQGGTTVTILGENFGAQPGGVTVCSSASEITDWTDTRVVFLTPECFSGPQPIVLSTVDGVQTQSPIPFGYEPPVIEDVSPTSLPARGGRTITIIGRNFGVASAPRTVLVDGAVAEPVEWRSHQEFLVSTPPVLPGRTVPVCVIVGDEGPVCWDVSTAAILLSSVDPSSGPPSGGIRLTIRGENFGADAATPRTVRLGTLAATDVSLVDDSTLLATSPPSQSSGPVDLTVEVAGASSTLPSGFTYETSTSVESLPTEFALHGNEPNPFSSRTAIAFDLPRASSYRLTVYDVRGRKVREVADRAGPGRVILQWNGSDTSGAPMASGIYFYRFETEGFSETRRMVLMR